MHAPLMPPVRAGGVGGDPRAHRSVRLPAGEGDPTGGKAHGRQGTREGGHEHRMEGTLGRRAPVA